MKQLSLETFTLLQSTVFESMIEEFSQWSSKDIVRSGFTSIYDYSESDLLDYLVTTENPVYDDLITQVKLELGL